MTSDRRLPEEVVVNGVTLHSPVLAGRAWRPEEYPPARQELWRRAIADSGVAPSIYPGSFEQPCEVCTIAVAVGPRQQEAQEVARGVGLAVHVLCLLCAAERSRPGTAVGHLGNPFLRASD